MNGHMNVKYCVRRAISIPVTQHNRPKAILIFVKMPYVYSLFVAF
jgi:hypothetical protein